VIVGNVGEIGPSISNGFIRNTDGSFTIFIVNGVVTTAYGINDAGQVVGYYDGNGTQGGYLRNADGTLTYYNPVGSYFSLPSSINNLGQIAGIFDDTQGEHGFVRDPDGTITTIDYPGAGPNDTTDVWGIDDQGRLTGDFTMSDGTIVAFIATPVPEPNSLAVAGITMLLAGACTRRSWIR
jgi:hypothetical protein